MTTSEQVEAAWEEKVLTHVAVAEFTPVYFLFDASEADESAFHLSRLYHEAQVNFFQLLVRRAGDPNQVAGGLDSTRYTFEVRVEYYLQQSDAPADTSRTHRARLEAVDDLVRTELRGRWGDTVDYWRAGVPERQQKVVIDGRACWRGAIAYTAFKQI